MGKSIVPGVRVPEQGKALYLDWETSKESTRRRFLQFVKNQKNVAYKRMQAPLSDVADELEQLIRAEKFGLVICDSASMASGGEIIDEASVTRYFMASRGFKTTMMTLAHKAKMGDGPIGSVFWRNQVRVEWELVKDQIEGDSIARLDLIQTKGNNDQTHKPFSLEMDFSGPQIVYRSAMSGAADETRLPLASRIDRWLSNEGKATAVEISEALGKPLNQILNTLKHGEGKMFKNDGGKRDRIWYPLIHNVNKNYSQVNNDYSHDPSPLKGGERGSVHNSLEKQNQTPKVDTERIKADESGDLDWEKSR